MRLNIALTPTLTLCGALLFSASGPRAQGVVGRTSSSAARYASGPGGLDLIGPLATIQPQPAMRPRMTPAAETVPVSDLVVPPKAAKEFERSMKAFQSGDFQSAAGHLEKAIHIDPEFVQAHNNLGATYLNLREYDSAAIQFQKTIELAPKLQEPYHNLGMALMLLRRFPEAEVAVRHALDIAPQRLSARYTLGRILAMEGSTTPEAVEMLSQVATERPEARLPLAQVLLNRGAVDQAAAELRTYLKDPDPAKKQLVECWLAQITHEPGSQSCMLAKQKP
jgi:thioredoxin-like negative regulator of GroEL